MLLPPPGSLNRKQVGDRLSRLNDSAEGPGQVRAGMLGQRETIKSILRSITDSESAASLRGPGTDEKVFGILQHLSSVPHLLAKEEAAAELEGCLQDLGRARNACLDRVATLSMSSTLPGECGLG